MDLLWCIEESYHMVENVSFCSSIGVSTMPMCPRLVDGHTNNPDQP
jgi:hypothetical protein